MKRIIVFLLVLVSFLVVVAQVNKPPDRKVMEGFPPSRNSQVTFGNYREYPFSQWSFRHAGAPFHVLMVPRAGRVYPFKEKLSPAIGQIETVTATGKKQTFETVFRENYADGVIILHKNTVVYENYYNGLTRDYQHIWFSVTKSLTSSAFGILVDQKQVELAASPAKYIPELKGSGFERVTIQDLLNQSTALDFQENYTDTSSHYLKYYGPAIHLFEAPGGQSPVTNNKEPAGVYDFAAHFVKPNTTLVPGEVFEYQSVNVDVLGWLMARITGTSYVDYIRENIWAKMGAEHDAYIAADPALMGVATGGMNTTLRDAALFGNLILNRGNSNGQQIIPASWVDETLVLTAKDKARYQRNTVYPKAHLPWVGYKNLWWILDEKKGEYAGLGIYGQVIYLNRSAHMVIAYFSSQPVASSAGNPTFLSKLYACRSVAEQFSK